jgi:hypothetical protein
VSQIALSPRPERIDGCGINLTSKSHQDFKGGGTRYSSILCRKTSETTG